MGVLFDVSEILKIALTIEENGIKFYREYAQKEENGKVKEIFSYLAEEEVIHKKLFGEMLSKIEKYEQEESYSGEYLEYFRSYVDNIIFNRKKIDKEISQIKDTLSAIDFAINRELDSIFYYSEIKNLVPKSQRDKIDMIIEEERKHFLKLQEAKNLVVERR